MNSHSLFSRFIVQYDVILCIFINLLPAISALVFKFPNEWAAIQIHIVLLFITGAYVLYKFADRVSRDCSQAISEVREFIGRNVGLQFPKGTAEAVQYLNENAHRIVKARNVYVVTAKASQRGRYDLNALSETLTLYDVCLKKKGVVWQDVIYGDHELYAERFVRIERDEMLATLYVDRLNHEIPLINFVIVTYEGGEEEVLFGWGLHGHEPDGKVFLSNNPHMVAYFRNYHKSLQDASKALTDEEVDDLFERKPDGGKSSIVRKFRRWLALDS